MKRPESSNILLGVFLIITIALSSYILVFNTQLGNLQKQNDDLLSQNNELLDQVGSLQNQNDLLRNQTEVMQNQTNELQKQNADLENQTVQLKDQKLQLQNQISQLQNGTAALQDQVNHLTQKVGDLSSTVKIIKFEWVDVFDPIGGLTMYNPIKLTVRNYGLIPTGELSIKAELFKHDDKTQINTPMGTAGGSTVEPLAANETREVGAYVLTTLGDSFFGTVCVVMVKDGNTLIDQWAEYL